MTGEPPPPTRETLEEKIALLIGALLAIVSSLIDATQLSSTARTRLREAFAELFARLEAQLILMVQQARARNAEKQLIATTKAAQPARQTTPTPTPTRRPRTKTTPTPSAPQPASAPIEQSPIAEAPPQKRAPAPHHPARAPTRAVAMTTIFTRPNPENFQKAAYTTQLSHAQIVTLSQQYHKSQAKQTFFPITPPSSNWHSPPPPPYWC